MLSPYLLQESDSYSYEFITDNRVTYHIYFLDYAYMFADYAYITCPIYTFNIDAIDGDPTTTAEDARIKLTVLEVFKLFFSRVANVAIYVCDSLDERHLARKRKFDAWFKGFNDDTILKEDGVATVEGVAIYNALLVHKQNKELAAIVAAFNDLNSNVGDK